MVRPPPPLRGKLGGTLPPTPHEIGVSDITVVFLKLETSIFLQSSSFELYYEIGVSDVTVIF